MKWYHGVGLLVLYFSITWFSMAPIYDRQFADCMEDGPGAPVYCKKTSEVEALMGSMGWPFYFFIVTAIDRGNWG